MQREGTEKNRWETGTGQRRPERRKNNKQKVEARTAVEPDKAGIKMEDRMGEQRRREAVPLSSFPEASSQVLISSAIDK